MRERQHWIPSSYIKHFAYENSDYVSVINFKKQQKILKVNSINVAVEANYNESKMLKGTELELLEKKLSIIEGKAELVFKKINNSISNGLIKNNLSILEKEDIEILSRYIAHLFLRTKKFRNILRESTPVLSRGRNQIKLINVKTGEKDDTTKYYHLMAQNIFAELLHRELVKCHWKILINKTDKEWITSDAPVILFGNLDNNNGFMGQSSNNIFLPVFPKLALKVSSYNLSIINNEIENINEECFIKDMNDNECINAEYFIIFRDPPFVSAGFNGRLNCVN